MRDTIPDLLEDEGFIVAMTHWNNYHAYGFPYTGGWMEQPCQLIDVIRLFDSLFEKHRKKDGGK